MGRVLERNRRKDETSRKKSAGESLSPCSRISTGFLLFAGLMTVYLSSGREFCISHDTTANYLLPLNMYARGSLFFSPRDFPQLFEWELHANERCRPHPLRLANLTSPVASDLLSRDKLRVRRERYFLMRTAFSSSSYANVFGVGAGIVALPFVAATSIFVDLEEDVLAASNFDVVYFAGKIAASACVSIAAVALYAIMREEEAREKSAPSIVSAPLLLALHFGLCTSMWSTASQGLWQHGPNALFVCLALRFLGSGRQYVAGACLGAAVFCRPNSVLVTCAFVASEIVGPSGIRGALRTSIGGAPFALLFFAYNRAVLGSALSTSQTIKSVDFLAMKGRDSLFGTPLAEGLAGLLFSPSRGLFVFSPLFLAAFVGSVASCGSGVRTRRRLRKTMQVHLPGVLLLLSASKWYDWWGGYCYGCRPLIDALPFATLASAPFVRSVLATERCGGGVRRSESPRGRGRCGGRARRVFVLGFMCLSFVWAFALQALGVATYNASTWNHYTYDPDSGEGVPLSVDSPEGRHRLWSAREGQIAHLWSNFEHARSLKLFKMRHYSRGVLGLYLDSLFEEETSLAETIESCAKAERDAGARSELVALAQSIRGKGAL